MSCWTTCSAAGSPSPTPTRAGHSRRSTTSCCPRPGRRNCPSLLDRVHALTGIAEHDGRLRHVHYDWLDAGERTQATVRQLSEQLRRFLDDQVWFENRRVIDILRSIESHALELREAGHVPVTMEIDAAAPAIGCRWSARCTRRCGRPRCRQRRGPRRGRGRPTPPPCSSRSTWTRAAARRRPPGAARPAAGRAGGARRAASAGTGARGTGDLPVAARTSAFAIVFDDSDRDQMNWTGR